MVTTRVGAGPWVYFDVLFEKKDEVYVATDVFDHVESDYKPVTSKFYRTSLVISNLVLSNFKTFTPKFTMW
jgi:hypothetical protein